MPAIVKIFNASSVANIFLASTVLGRTKRSNKKSEEIVGWKKISVNHKEDEDNEL